MSHVFVSFVSENAKLASWVAEQLKLNGLEPWFSEDVGTIFPGENWKQAFRRAIEEGGYYVPIFTKEWVSRKRSVAHEELLFAVDEGRLRQTSQPWIIPILAHPVEVPSVDLGGGRRLSDIQFADIPKLGWERGLKSLLTGLGVEAPSLDHGEPLAEGFGANASVVGGFVTYRNWSIPIPELDGTSFTVTGGSVERDENGELIAKFRLRAPFESLQELNEQFGFDSIDVKSSDLVVSRNAEEPSHFSFVDEKDRRPAGAEYWQMGSHEPVRSAVSTEQVTGYDAYGYLNAQDQIQGRFSGFVETSSQLGTVKVTFDGDFMLQLKETFLPPR